MEEESNGKPSGHMEIRPMVVIAPDESVSGSSTLPCAEILSDSEPIPVAVADTCRSTAVNGSETPFPVQSLDDLDQAERFPWAEIIPDDLSYMREPGLHATSFVEVDGIEIGPEDAPWAEILDHRAEYERTDAFRRSELAGIEAMSEAAGAGRLPFIGRSILLGGPELEKTPPAKWYHESPPIPVPVMPIAFFMMMIFVLFW